MKRRGNVNFTITLTEQEILAIKEVCNRANEIDYPTLKYYNILLKLEEKLDKIVEQKLSSE